MTDTGLDKEIMKIGDYLPQIYKKDENEYSGTEKLKDGDVFWTIRMDKDGWYDTLDQDKALIISNQVKLERKVLGNSLFSILTLLLICVMWIVLMFV